MLDALVNGNVADTVLDIWLVSAFTKSNGRAIPLLIGERHELEIITAEMTLTPRPGQTLVSLIIPLGPAGDSAMIPLAAATA